MSVVHVIKSKLTSGNETSAGSATTICVLDAASIHLMSVIDMKVVTLRNLMSYKHDDDANAAQDLFGIFDADTEKPVEPKRDRRLPKAYNGCTCVCHRMVVSHMMACCWPTRKVKLEIEEIGPGVRTVEMIEIEPSYCDHSPDASMRCKKCGVLVHV